MLSCSTESEFESQLVMMNILIANSYEFESTIYTTTESTRTRRPGLGEHRVGDESHVTTLFNKLVDRKQWTMCLDSISMMLRCGPARGEAIDVLLMNTSGLRTKSDLISCI